jgi:ABC-2 type transport system ATP-binding protein
MRQRLGIAGALIRSPRLLLLDEPATGLDPAGMRDMRALIRSLGESGITVLLSSHLMNEVEELCNRVAIIRAGRIVYEGRLDELRASAAGSYTLRTSDDTAAAQICGVYPGLRELVVLPDGLRMRADEATIESLTLELARSGIALRALVPDAASLEERFFALTEDPAPGETPKALPELERVA